MFQHETPNLILRDFVESDWVDAHQLCANPQVTYHIDFIATETEAETQKWIAGCIHHNGLVPRVSYNLAIVRKADDRFVGWIGIGEADDKTYGDQNFGYAIIPQYWGNGYATEALVGLLEIGFEHLNAERIFGECDEENPASGRVMEKADMKFERQYEEFEEATEETGVMRVYSLSKGEWIGTEAILLEKVSNGLKPHSQRQSE